MVMEVVHEDMGDVQCTNHPYRNSSSPGGICGLCLQEKLGKLVSSSFPVPIFPSSTSSSSSPSSSFRSDLAATTNSTTITTTTTTSQNNDCTYTKKPSRLPFVLTNTNKNKKNHHSAGNNNVDSASVAAFKKSKSTKVPRRGMHLFDHDDDDHDGGSSSSNNGDFTPHRRGFWSFLYLSKHNTGKKVQSSTTVSSTVGSVSSSMVNNSGVRLRDSFKRDDFVVVEEEEEENGSSPSEAAAAAASVVDRKVSRSRSVGCGSRSFSGLGDCTLRRVESQREGKHHNKVVVKNGQDCNKERVKCGGIFSGFMINSSSSSAYWDGGNVSGRRMSAVHSSSMGHVAEHGRSKSWGWALASPMRAFSKPSSTSGKREAETGKKSTPDLSAIPSLLAVSS